MKHFFTNFTYKFFRCNCGYHKRRSSSRSSEWKNILYLFTLCIHIIFFIWINDEFFPFLCFYFLTYIKTKLLKHFFVINSFHVFRNSTLDTISEMTTNQIDKRKKNINDLEKKKQEEIVLFFLIICNNLLYFYSF